MGIFFQLILNGLIVGSIYSLVSSGFNLIYSTNRFVHFAHGSIIAFSSYLFHYLLIKLRVGLSISIVLSIIAAATIGYLMNFLIYKMLRKRKASNVILLIASVALLIFFQSIILILFGADIKTINYIKTVEGIQIFGVSITPLQIIILITAVISFVGLRFFIKKTQLGKACVAVSDNKEVAEVLGISSEKIYSLTFIIGSAIAGVAGVLVSLEQNLEPGMGTTLMIKGFAAAIIGGIGVVEGAFLGAIILGIAENLGAWYFPSGYKDAISFVLLFLFLLFKPKGILGFNEERDGK